MGAAVAEHRDPHTPRALAALSYGACEQTGQGRNPAHTRETLQAPNAGLPKCWQLAITQLGFEELYTLSPKSYDLPCMSGITSNGA